MVGFISKFRIRQSDNKIQEKYKIAFKRNQHVKRIRKSAKICKNLSQLKSFKTWTNLPRSDLFSSDLSSVLIKSRLDSRLLKVKLFLVL